jgi:hypothetical protein
MLRMCATEDTAWRRFEAARSPEDAAGRATYSSSAAAMPVGTSPSSVRTTSRVS